MAQAQRSTSAWKSEPVTAAVVAGLFGVVIAVVTLARAPDGDDDAPAATTSSNPSADVTVSPSPAEPLVSIEKTTFSSHPSGETAIRVSGTALNLPASERLFAVAYPDPLIRPNVWWVSEHVVPDEEGDWQAQVLAAAGPGEEVNVTALRTSGVLGGEGFDDPVSLSISEIRSQLLLLGLDAPVVQDQAPPLTWALPPQP